MALVKKSCQEGADPNQIADMIIDIAIIDDPKFRYPAGKQAAEILPRLQKMSEKERDDFIRNASKIDWWMEGRSKPK